MSTVFLSYSTRDHHFAELLAIKLQESGIALWRDQGQLRPGSDWRDAIERGISESAAVLVALSQYSAESAYVTFEWAYGLGKGKTVIPLKLEACQPHSRLEPIQYLDFSNPGFLPWSSLVERIREVESEATQQDDVTPHTELPLLQLNPLIESILAYQRERGFLFLSFDRVRRKIDASQTDQQLRALVDANPSIFRHAVLKDAKPGLKRLVP